MHDANEVEEQPAFGVVQFNRIAGTGRRLFGSELGHHDTIMLRVNTCERVRRHHEDRYFAKQRLIEVEMSPSQFAGLLTTMNVGDGVPCTIRFRQDLGHVRYDQGEPVREKFDREVTEKGQIIYDRLAELEQAIAETKMSEKDRKRLRDLVSRAEADVRSNLPFVLSQMREKMDEVVTDAKAQVEAFVTGVVARTGLTALRQQAPQLTGRDSPQALPQALPQGEK